MTKLHFILLAIMSTIGLTINAQNSSFGAFTVNNLYVNPEGKIGIGTTNPTQLLTVNGRILCEEVEVVLDVGPDYVFEKYYTGKSSTKSDYKMPSLQELEVYIKANHHLPEVPSAKEMKEDGVEMKEMMRLLLQKVEELTLYTIEQEKKIEKQQETINTLQSQLTH